MIGASLADNRFRFMYKVFQLFCRKHGRKFLFPTCFIDSSAVDSCAICTHQSCNIRTGDIMSDFLLKAAQNCIVQEGSALYNDVFSQFIRTSCTNYLVEYVFNNTHRKSCGNIFYACAILLSLFYRRVHEYRAS